MNEIKFRDWDEEKKEMYIPLEIQFSGNVSFYKDGPITTLTPHILHLMQYIGLKDKKRTKEFPEGQEIYEGDILRVRGRKKVGYYNSEVIYQKQGFTLKSNKTYLNDDSCLLVGVEVIGNIHQNPELI